VLSLAAAVVRSVTVAARKRFAFAEKSEDTLRWIELSENAKRFRAATVTERTDFMLIMHQSVNPATHQLLAPLQKVQLDHKSEPH
jgi:hypothetical protein